MEVREKHAERGAGRQMRENQEICFEYAEFKRTTDNPAGNIKSAAGRATEAKGDDRTSDTNVPSDG